MNYKVAFLFMNNGCKARKITVKSKLSRFPMLEEVGEEILHEVVEEVGRARH
jgi:hypothetical protein